MHLLFERAVLYFPVLARVEDVSTPGYDAGLHVRAARQPGQLVLCQETREPACGAVTSEGEERYYNGARGGRNVPRKKRTLNSKQGPLNSRPNSAQVSKM